jgi:hypothetical protein
MKHARLLAALLLTSPLTAAAQVVVARSAAPAASAETPAEKPEPTCVCARHNYKPLSAKGTAAKEYWDARRRAKSSRTVSSIAFLFGYLAQSGATVNEAQNSYGSAMGELAAARAKAEAAGAVKIVGEDLDEESVEFLLKKGVDYTLAD